MKTILVIGMYRSGTSVLGSILREMNCNLGNNLIGKQWSNPTGHNENIDFVRLNDHILKCAGGSWDYPPTRRAILGVRGEVDADILQVIEKH